MPYVPEILDKEYLAGSFSAEYIIKLKREFEESRQLIGRIQAQVNMLEAMVDITTPAANVFRGELQELLEMVDHLGSILDIPK